MISTRAALLSYGAASDRSAKRSSVGRFFSGGGLSSFPRPYDLWGCGRKPRPEPNRRSVFRQSDLVFVMAIGVRRRRKGIAFVHINVINFSAFAVDDFVIARLGGVFTRIKSHIRYLLSKYSMGRKTPRYASAPDFFARRKGRFLFCENHEKSFTREEHFFSCGRSGKFAVRFPAAGNMPGHPPFLLFHRDRLCKILRPIGIQPAKNRRVIGQ